MITANFIIVKEVLLYPDGEYIIDYEIEPVPPTSITFSGNRIVKMVNPTNIYTMEEVPLYGRILVAYEMDEIKFLYIILKNKTIFSVDDWSYKDINTAIRMYEVIKDFESLKLIRAFISL